MLSDSDSDGGDDVQLTVNEHFAKAYAYRKEREELQKLKDKYGSDASEGDLDESEDSEELESEDEDGEELTPAVDAAILRTLARIKKKDPAIYGESNIFEEERNKTTTRDVGKRAKTKDKSKPLTLRQQALDSALHGDPESRSPSPSRPLTHVEEQKALREEAISAFHHAVEEEDDGLFVSREKTKDEVEQEEELYKDWLEREVGEDLRELVTVDAGGAGAAHEGDGGEVEKKKKGKKERKAEKESKGPKMSKEESDQQFLLDYILNRGWIDRSSKRVPTYTEITAGPSTSKKRKTEEVGSDEEGSVEGGDNLLSDNEFDEVADRFESSYNFRFEEPDAATIKTYPRTLPSTVRREDTARKEAREKRKARKEEELLKKQEEVRRLKALKIKEMRDKLEQIAREGGAKDWEEDPALQALDLDGDWDPSKHDRQMGDIYGKDVDEVDEEKPTWEDDLDIGDIVPDFEEDQGKKKKKKKKKKGGEDDADDGVDVDAMDADRTGEGGDWEEEWDGTEETRKRVLDEYMEELYGMEFNDMVGDLPTRFKYTPVQPDSFGLTPAEILMATDAELNSYVGLRKFAPYRAGRGSGWDNQRNEKLRELRAGLRDRVGELATEDGERKKKRKGKKERMRAKEGAEGGEGEEGEGKVLGKRAAEAEVDTGVEGDAQAESKKKRKRHKKDKA